MNTVPTRRRITIATYKGGVCVSEHEVDPRAPDKVKS